MQVQEAYICSAVRTPVGKAPRGVFRKTRPDDLLAHCLTALLKQNPGLDPAAIEDVIVGCAMPEAEQGMNVARIALLLAGLPDSVPGVTVNRFCASGLQAVAMAAEAIMLGRSELVVAAGTESMSLIPMMGHKVVMNPKIIEDSQHTAIAYGMGITAEKVAAQYHVTREEQDAFALQSHQRALAAQKAGLFTQEIVPYSTESFGLPDTRHAQAGLGQNPATLLQMVTDDEGPRPDTTLASLAKLRAVFDAKGSVTAGNSSQMSDGAAALLVASEAAILKHKLTPLAKFRGFAVAGVPPEIMGIGPIAAIPKVLNHLHIRAGDVDWIELNEAFAAQSLAVIKELALNPVAVNPLGGAIALGHPLGATGAIRTATLVHGLQRQKMRYGMVTMCIGTGMGAAGIFERV